MDRRGSVGYGVGDGGGVAGMSEEKYTNWSQVQLALSDTSIWDDSLPDLKTALSVCVRLSGSGNRSEGKKCAAAVTVIQDIIATQLRELELAAATEANRLARKEADEKATRADKRSRVALRVSWVISAAAVFVSILGLLSENPVVPEVKALREELAGVKAELVALRKAEERADHVIVVPGEVK